MTFVKFRDMDLDEQIELLWRAVKQLKERFDDHDHSRDGGVRIGVFSDGVDVDGRFENEVQDDQDEDC